MLMLKLTSATLPANVNVYENVSFTDERIAFQVMLHVGHVTGSLQMDPVLRVVVVFRVLLSSECCCLQSVVVFRVLLSSECCCLQSVVVFRVLLSSECCCLQSVVVFRVLLSSECRSLQSVVVFRVL